MEGFEDKGVGIILWINKEEVHRMESLLSSRFTDKGGPGQAGAAQWIHPLPSSFH